MAEMKPSGVQWIGDIPVDWNISVLGRYVKQVKNKNTDLLETNLLSLSYGKVKRKDISANDGLLPASFDGYNIIEEGDIVLRLTDLQNDHTSLRVGRATERGIITSAYVTIRPEKYISSEYLYYVLHSFDIVKGFYGMGAGIRQGLTYDGVQSLKIPSPAMPEQQAIADYLDDRCSKIDEIIAEATASIEEYKELKQAVITEAVIGQKGDDFEYKECNLGWISKIPKSWSKYSLSQVSLSMRNGYVGPTRDLFVDDGVRYIQSLHIKDGIIDFERGPYYVTEEWGKAHPKIHTGDILLVQTGDIGQVGLVNEAYDGCNCHALIIIEPRHDIILSEYLIYYLRSYIGKEGMLLYKTGAMLPHLNAGKVKYAPVICPNSLEEQRKIVIQLEKECKQLDSLISEKQSLISDLQAYKKSLIYEVVTGKRRVV